MGSARVYIIKLQRGWIVTADPEDIFEELFETDEIPAKTEDAAINKAYQVLEDMERNSPFGHPDDSEILISRLPVPSGTAPVSYSIEAQDAMSDALYRAKERLGMYPPLGVKGPDVSRAVQYREALKELKKMPLSREVRNDARHRLHSHLSEWEELPLTE